MRILDLTGISDGRERGKIHGETYRPLIQELASIRLDLCLSLGSFTSPQEVREIAEQHLPILRMFDESLYQELAGIGEGAEISLVDLVILNHYTDLRDIDTRNLSAGNEEGCSIVYLPPHLIGQTWDMHGSARPYVILLKSTELDGTTTLVLSLAGCLALAGMNQHGVTVTINNLRSSDARVGLLWPALVRRLLRFSSAKQGHEALLDAELGSGHHYLIADEREAYGTETSGKKHKVLLSGTAQGPYFHTNHCIDPEMQKVTPVADTSTSYQRYQYLSDSLNTARQPAGPGPLWRLLGSHEGYPRSICTHLATPQAPHESTTCGALVMDMKNRVLLAADGCIHNNEPNKFQL